MAVQVGSSERSIDGSRPRLYVIDFAQPAVYRTFTEPPARLLTLRRRRMVRRLRQAGAAASWAAGAVALTLLLLGAFAGLR